MKRIIIVAAAFLALSIEAALSGGVTLGVFSSGGGGGAIVNACAAIGNQLDYSDNTGCNLVQMMTGRP